MPGLTLLRCTESLVTICHSIQPFWLEFQAIVGGDVQARFYDAFHFHDNKPAANELARLVLECSKSAAKGVKVQQKGSGLEY